MTLSLRGGTLLISAKPVVSCHDSQDSFQNSGMRCGIIGAILYICLTLIVNHYQRA